MKTVLLVVCVVLCTTSMGCVSFIEALGYTVVDEELQGISKVRDDFTQEYITATLPLIEASPKEADEKAKLLDMGKTLARVSRKERELIARDVE